MIARGRAHLEELVGLSLLVPVASPHFGDLQWCCSQDCSRPVPPYFVPCILFLPYLTFLVLHSCLVAKLYVGCHLEAQICRVLIAGVARRAGNLPVLPAARAAIFLFCLPA